MLSSQVRQGVLRDRHMAAKDATPAASKASSSSSASSIVTRLSSKTQLTTRYEALEELEHQLRLPEIVMENIVPPADIDACVLHLVDYAQSTNVTILVECKIRMVLSYFTSESDIFPNLSQKTIHVVMHDVLNRLETASANKSDRVIVPVLFMLISNFEFETTMISTKVWKQLATLVVNSVCLDNDLTLYMCQMVEHPGEQLDVLKKKAASVEKTTTSLDDHREEGGGGGGGGGISSSSSSSSSSLIMHTMLEYIAALQRLLSIVPPIMEETAPKWVIHLCYLSIMIPPPPSSSNNADSSSSYKLVSKQVASSLRMLTVMIMTMCPVPKEVSKALSVEMGEITTTGTPLLQPQLAGSNASNPSTVSAINTTSLLFLFERSPKNNLLKTLSIWPIIIHLLGKRMGVKTKVASSSAGGKLETILNRLLRVATAAFSDRSTQRVLIRTTIMKGWKSLMDHFIRNKNLGSYETGNGQKLLINFQLEQKLNIIMKPLRICMKSQTYYQEEKTTCFETWAYFCVELHTLQRLHYPNILAQVMIPLLTIFIESQNISLQNKVYDLLKWMIHGEGTTVAVAVADGTASATGGAAAAVQCMSSSPPALPSTSTSSPLSSSSSSNKLSDANTMFLMALSGKQIPSLMPRVQLMEQKELQLLKQHLSCLPDLFQKFGSSLSKDHADNILHLAHVMEKSIEHEEAKEAKRNESLLREEKKLSIGIKRPNQSLSSSSSSSSSFSSSSSPPKKMRASSSASSSKSKSASKSASKRQFLTERQREMARKQRPTYTTLDGTQHSQSSQQESDRSEEEEEEDRDEGDGEEEDRDEGDGEEEDRGQDRDEDADKNKKKEKGSDIEVFKDRRMDVEEDIEQFDSVTPSFSGNSSGNSIDVADSKLFDFAKQNSIDPDDLKSFVTEYLKSKIQ